MLRPIGMRLLLSLVAVLACAACADTERDSAGPPGVPGQQVVLHHCGVQPVTFKGRSWEVEEPPFDQTNAPDSFSGFGQFDRNGDTLTFDDREGARLTFVVNDGTPNPYNCG